MTTESNQTLGKLIVSSVLSDNHRVAICNIGEGQRLIAEVIRGDGDGAIIAQRIVTAVNMHDELIEALQEFCTRVENGEILSKKTYVKFKQILEKSKTK